MCFCIPEKGNEDCHLEVLSPIMFCCCCSNGAERPIRGRLLPNAQLPTPLPVLGKKNQLSLRSLLRHLDYYLLKLPPILSSNQPIVL